MQKEDTDMSDWMTSGPDRSVYGCLRGELGGCHMMIHLPVVGTSPLLAGARFSISAKHNSKTLSAGVEMDWIQPRKLSEPILTDIDRVFGTCFYPGSLIFLGQFLSFFWLHLPSGTVRTTDWRWKRPTDTTTEPEWSSNLVCKSVLEPTMTHGMSFIPQKSIILSYTIWIMSNEFLEVTE